MTSNPEVQKHGAIRPPLEDPLFDFSDSRELGRVTTTVNVTNGKQWSRTHGRPQFAFPRGRCHGDPRLPGYLRASGLHDLPELGKGAICAHAHGCLTSGQSVARVQLGTGQPASLSTPRSPSLQRKAGAGHWRVLSPLLLGRPDLWSEIWLRANCSS